jgi:hypothetical protein
MAKRITHTKRPAKPMTDKWIVGMVSDKGQIEMFRTPYIFTDYDKAVAEAELRYQKYGRAFVVFAKKCVIGPSRPPILKQEYLA